ncbi:MAG: hypothetical protein VYE53_03710, partial [Planctomycetota bacterium]|nr:hypothetical protein [Planctomycetota bacterium]
AFINTLGRSGFYLSRHGTSLGTLMQGLLSAGVKTILKTGYRQNDIGFMNLIPPVGGWDS